MPPPAYRWRDGLIASDPAAIRALVESTGFFRADEAGVAEELALAALREGPASGYRFLLASPPGDDPAPPPAGYACFGPIPCTVRRYDLYWIAVSPGHQGQGLGKALLAASLERMADLGGVTCYAETSGTDRYLPTRRFYERTGGRQAARVPGYYDDGDDMVIYAWNLRPDGERGGRRDRHPAGEAVFP